MTKAPEEPKRGRGRPRLAADEKKRRNMTFRVRDELRDAVEELAIANGRSLSEQVEHYVERGVQADAGDAYLHDSRSFPPALFKWMTGLAKKSTASDDDHEPEDTLRGGSPKEYFAFNPKLGSKVSRMLNALSHDVMASQLGDELTPEKARDIERSRQVLDAKLADRERFEKPVEAANEEQKVIAELERELALRRTEREWALQLELASARTEIEALKSKNSQPNSTSRSRDGT